MCLRPVVALGVGTTVVGVELEEGVFVVLLVLTWSFTHSVKVHKIMHTLIKIFSII